MSCEEYTEIMEVINKKLDKLIGPSPTFITRTEIVRRHKRRFYDMAVMRDKFHPRKGKGRNAKIEIDIKEYNAYLEYLKL